MTEYRGVFTSHYDGGLYFFTKASGSWQRIVMDVPWGSNSAPVTACYGEDTLYVVDNGYAHMYLHASHDDGASWDSFPMPTGWWGGSGFHVQHTDRVLWQDGRIHFLMINTWPAFEYSYSDDGGETWAPPELVYEPSYPDSSEDGCIWLDDSGIIHVILGNSETITHITSGDNGDSWDVATAPCPEPNLSRQMPHAVVSSGDTIAFVSGARSAIRPWETQDGALYFYSTDAGETWEYEWLTHSYSTQVHGMTMTPAGVYVMTADYDFAVGPTYRCFYCPQWETAPATMGLLDMMAPQQDHEIIEIMGESYACAYQELLTPFLYYVRWNRIPREYSIHEWEPGVGSTQIAVGNYDEIRHGAIQQWFRPAGGYSVWW